MHWSTILGVAGISGIIVWLAVTEIRAALPRGRRRHGEVTR